MYIIILRFKSGDVRVWANRCKGLTRKELQDKYTPDRIILMKRIKSNNIVKMLDNLTDRLTIEGGNELDDFLSYFFEKGMKYALELRKKK